MQMMQASPKNRWLSGPMIHLPLFSAIIALQGCGTFAPSRPYPGYALFEDRCKNVAGEKIYRKVENVEGIFLTNIRTRDIKKEESINYPGAAFAIELHNDDYIMSFLSYEHSSMGPGGRVTPSQRGYITPDYQERNPVNIAGYKFVDAVDPKDGLRYRYTLAKRPVENSTIGSTEIFLKKTLAIKPPPKYEVYFEDHVIPNERASGLASTTIKIADTETKEILGEYISYAYGGAVDAKNINNRINWLAASQCPQRTGSSYARTRLFVDQVLIPTKNTSGIVQ